MTNKQLFAVFFCIMVNTLDGFDVLVVAFAASSIAKEWDLSPQSLGILLSSGLLGMTIGSIIIAPFADRYGRRPITIICLFIITVGMFLAALSDSLTQLAVVRFITGLGIGGMLASLNTLVAEYSPLRLRSLMVSLLQSGYPVGAAGGGIVSVFLIGEYGWRSLFWFGGGMSLIMLPIAFWRMPESAEFLFSQGTETALAKGNREREKLGLAPLEALPAITAEQSGGMLTLIWGTRRTQTILLWICFFMVMLAWYFVASWTPKLLVDAGLNVQQGISGGVILSIGAVIGGVLLGLLSVRHNVFYLTCLYTIIAGISLLTFAQFAHGLGSMLFFSGLMGFGVAGTMVGLYSCAPHVYPPTARNTGLGWAIGFGRGGAVLGPYIAGELLASDISRSHVYMLFSVPMLGALIAMWYLAKKQAFIVPTKPPG